MQVHTVTVPEPFSSSHSTFSTSISWKGPSVLFCSSPSFIQLLHTVVVGGFLTRTRLACPSISSSYVVLERTDTDTALDGGGECEYEGGGGGGLDKCTAVSACGNVSQRMCERRGGGGGRSSYKEEDGGREREEVTKGQHLQLQYQYNCHTFIIANGVFAASDLMTDHG